MPTSSLTMSEQSARPPSAPSNSTHTAREPLPSIPLSQARAALSARRSTTGRAGGRAAAATPRWARR